MAVDSSTASASWQVRVTASNAPALEENQEDWSHGRLLLFDAEGRLHEITWALNQPQEQCPVLSLEWGVAYNVWCYVQEYDRLARESQSVRKLVGAGQIILCPKLCETPLLLTNVRGETLPVQVEFHTDLSVFQAQKHQGHFERLQELNESRWPGSKFTASIKKVCDDLDQAFLCASAPPPAVVFDTPCVATPAGSGDLTAAELPLWAYARASMPHPTVWTRYGSTTHQWLENLLQAASFLLGFASAQELYNASESKSLPDQALRLEVLGLACTLMTKCCRYAPDDLVDGYEVDQWIPGWTSAGLNEAGFDCEDTAMLAFFLFHAFAKSVTDSHVAKPSPLLRAVSQLASRFRVMLAVVTVRVDNIGAHEDQAWEAEYCDHLVVLCIDDQAGHPDLSVLVLDGANAVTHCRAYHHRDYEATLPGFLRHPQVCGNVRYTAQDMKRSRFYGQVFATVSADSARVMMYYSQGSESTLGQDFEIAVYTHALPLNETDPDGKDGAVRIHQSPASFNMAVTAALPYILPRSCVLLYHAAKVGVEQPLRLSNETRAHTLRHLSGQETDARVSYGTFMCVCSVSRKDLLTTCFRKHASADLQLACAEQVCLLPGSDVYLGVYRLQLRDEEEEANLSETDPEAGVQGGNEKRSKTQAYMSEEKHTPYQHTPYQHTPMPARRLDTGIKTVPNGVLGTAVSNMLKDSDLNAFMQSSKATKEAVDWNLQTRRIYTDDDPGWEQKAVNLVVKKPASLFKLPAQLRSLEVSANLTDEEIQRWESMDHNLGDVTLPQNVHTLRLIGNIFSALKPNVIPQSVRDLKISISSICATGPIVLPDSLEKFDITAFELETEIPSSVRVLRLNLSNMATQPDLVLPRGLQELDFAGILDIPLEDLNCPPGLRKLSLEFYEGAPFSETTFPSQLETLSLTNRFTETLAGTQFPAGLKHLDLPRYRGPYSGVTFPEGLQTLSLSCLPIEPDPYVDPDRIILPPKLQSLSVRFYTAKWTEFEPPEGLKIFSIIQYDGSAQGVNIPDGLEMLNLDEATGLKHFRLPPKLKVLRWMNRNESLQGVNLPGSLRVLQLHPESPYLYDVPRRFPGSRINVVKTAKEVIYYIKPIDSVKSVAPPKRFTPSGVGVAAAVCKGFLEDEEEEANLSETDPEAGVQGGNEKRSKTQAYMSEEKHTPYQHTPYQHTPMPARRLDTGIKTVPNGVLGTAVSNMLKDSDLNAFMQSSKATKEAVDWNLQTRKIYTDDDPGWEQKAVNLVVKKPASLFYLPARLRYLAIYAHFSDRDIQRWRSTGRRALTGRSMADVTFPQGLHTLRLEGEICGLMKLDAIPQSVRDLKLSPLRESEERPFVLPVSLEKLDVESGDLTVAIPDSVRVLRLALFPYDESLKEILPKELQELDFVGDLMVPVAHTDFPPGLRKLSLRSYHGAPLSETTFPGGLESLLLGDMGDNTLVGAHFPAGLKHLDLPKYRGPYVGVTFPEGLQSLALDRLALKSDFYHADVDYLRFPPGLQSLRIRGYEPRVTDCHPPEGLKIFSVDDYSGPAFDIEFPDGLEMLNLDKATQLNKCFLPKNLKVLRWMNTTESLSGMQFPNSLQVLQLHAMYPHLSDLPRCFHGRRITMEKTPKEVICHIEPLGSVGSVAPSRRFASSGVGVAAAVGKGRSQKKEVRRQVPGAHLLKHRAPVRTLTFVSGRNGESQETKQGDMDNTLSSHADMMKHGPTRADVDDAFPAHKADHLARRRAFVLLHDPESHARLKREAIRQIEELTTMDHWRAKDKDLMRLATSYEMRRRRGYGHKRYLLNLAPIPRALRRQEAFETFRQMLMRAGSVDDLDKDSRALYDQLKAAMVKRVMMRLATQETFVSRVAQVHRGPDQAVGVAGWYTTVTPCTSCVDSPVVIINQVGLSSVHGLRSQAECNTCQRKGPEQFWTMKIGRQRLNADPSLSNLREDLVANTDRLKSTLCRNVIAVEGRASWLSKDEHYALHASGNGAALKSFFLSDGQEVLQETRDALVETCMLLETLRYQQLRQLKADDVAVLSFDLWSDLTPNDVRRQELKAVQGYALLHLSAVARARVQLLRTVGSGLWGLSQVQALAFFYQASWDHEASMRRWLQLPQGFFGIAPGSRESVWRTGATIPRDVSLVLQDMAAVQYAAVHYALGRWEYEPCLVSLFLWREGDARPPRAQGEGAFPFLTQEHALELLQAQGKDAGPGSLPESDSDVADEPAVPGGHPLRFISLPAVAPQSIGMINGDEKHEEVTLPDLAEDHIAVGAERYAEPFDGDEKEDYLRFLYDDYDPLLSSDMHQVDWDMDYTTNHMQTLVEPDESRPFIAS